MSLRAKWIAVAAGGVVVAGALIALILHQRDVLEQNRQEVARLEGEIQAGRDLVKGTPKLESEVIVQRETDAVIEEILSSEEEITTFFRTIQRFGDASGVAITSLKKQKTDTRSRGKKEAFERVAYTITLEADAFRFLSFLDEVESHSRFVSVTGFKLTGARRNVLDGGGEPVHSVTLDLETYVYEPKQGLKEVRIDGYERKRDMLLADIARRGSELRVPTYEYRGQRGRRDPWVDPRVPREVDGDTPVLTVEEQIRIVEELEAQAEECEALWADVEEAGTLVGEMKARAALEEVLARLEEDVRRVEEGGQITFVSARGTLDDVVVTAETIRQEMLNEPNVGPTLKELEELAASMRRHLEAEEYDLALLAFDQAETRLVLAERDPDKAPLVGSLRALAGKARTVLHFEAMPMEIGGVALMEGRRPVALINGESVVAGEYLDLSGELYVADVRPHEIEFVYQGVTLVRRMQESTSPESAPRRTGRNTADRRSTRP